MLFMDDTHDSFSATLSALPLYTIYYSKLTKLKKYIPIAIYTHHKIIPPGHVPGITWPASRASASGTCMWADLRHGRILAMRHLHNGGDRPDVPAASSTTRTVNDSRTSTEPLRWRQRRLRQVWINLIKNVNFGGEIRRRKIWWTIYLF